MIADGAAGAKMNHREREEGIRSWVRGICGQRPEETWVSEGTKVPAGMRVLVPKNRSV